MFSECGAPAYASAQPLDFLDLGKKSTFLNQKTFCAVILKTDAHQLDKHLPEGYTILLTVPTPIKDTDRS